MSQKEFVQYHCQYDNFVMQINQQNVLSDFLTESTTKDGSS